MSAIEPEKNSTVIIRKNQDSKETVKAAIINYDRLRCLITIDSKHFDPDETPQVSMLILEENNIIECQGIVRKQDSPKYREITIFNAKSKESRAAVRYNINMNATIENIIIAGKLVSLKEPITVNVENISTNGILISTTLASFNVNSSFQLKVNIAGSDVLINTMIVRIVNCSNKKRELGCRFISLSE